MNLAPATNKQLWRLNVEGKLALVDQGRPVTHSEAETVLRRLLEPAPETPDK